MNVLRRLAKIERKAYRENFSETLRLIREGRYYDELDEVQKAAYCAYVGCERQDMEIMERSINGSLHFKLELDSQPVDSKEAAEETESFFAEKAKEYNQPQEIERRRMFYEELHRIGELRKQAFIQGEDMDKYPLPF